MQVFLWSVIITAVAFLVHLIIWKVHLPKRQTKAILYIFFSVLSISLIMLWKFPLYIDLLKIGVPVSFWEYSHISLFVISSTITYIILYPAFEVDVPSLMIVGAIADAGSKGLEKEKLYEIVNNDKLIKPRVDDLILDKMAYIDNGKYRIAPKGIWMTKLFIFHRKLMKIEGKGG